MRSLIVAILIFGSILILSILLGYIIINEFQNQQNADVNDCCPADVETDKNIVPIMFITIPGICILLFFRNDIEQWIKRKVR